MQEHCKQRKKIWEQTVALVVQRKVEALRGCRRDGIQIGVGSDYADLDNRGVGGSFHHWGSRNGVQVAAGKGVQNSKKKRDVVMVQRKTFLLKHLESVLYALGGKQRHQFKPKKWAQLKGIRCTYTLSRYCWGEIFKTPWVLQGLLFSFRNTALQLIQQCQILNMTASAIFSRKKEARSANLVCINTVSFHVFRTVIYREFSLQHHTEVHK